MSEPALDSPVTLDQLRVFLAVVEEGSFSKAAKRLRRVQSAVSYSIANLERLLEVTLFDRTGRVPVLTPAGRALVADARSVHGQVSRLQAHARSLVDGVEPQLSLVVDVSVPTPVLTEALRHTAVGFAGVEITWQRAVLDEVERRVSEGESDLGIGLDRGSAHALSTTPIGRIPIVPVCAPRHALATGPIDGRSVGDALQLVVHGPDGSERDVPSLRVWRVPDHESKRALIEAGVGWGGLPEHLATPAIEVGRLCEIEPVGWALRESLDLVALNRREAPLGPAAREFLEHLAEGLRVSGTERQS
ncbi:MAG: LysR family transcriptional regulator [Sandaracinaceae bacterium]